MSHTSVKNGASRPASPEGRTDRESRGSGERRERAEWRSGNRRSFRGRSGWVSPEGIPYKEYAWADLLVATPPSVVMTAAMAALRATTTESHSYRDRPIPERAIVYMFHRDIHLSMFAPSFWRDLGGGFAYLAFHGFASYVGFVWPWLEGFTAFRYERGGPQRPMDQVREFLKGYPSGPFALRTDAGGPYGVVRASLVDLALATDRPLVAVRQSADRCTFLKGHALPLPGATIVTRVSEPIPAEALRGLAREAARELLQQNIDALGRETSGPR